MFRYVAFIRAVNVGGTGKLPMSELRAMCSASGFTDIQTYIASGNVVFSSDQSSDEVQQALMEKMTDYAGKPVGVMVRTASELRQVLDDNPFPEREPRFTLVIFLDEAPTEDALLQATGIADEEMVLGSQEIYIYYGSGMGRSKLKLPAASAGTARNINTVRKMVELSAS